MARMLANENVPGDVVAALLADGHDVTWMRDVGPGSPDDQVPALAFAENRIVLTFDKDFGELAFRLGQQATPGVGRPVGAGPARERDSRAGTASTPKGPRTLAAPEGPRMSPRGTSGDRSDRRPRYSPRDRLGPRAGPFEQRSPRSRRREFRSSRDYRKSGSPDRD